MSAMETCPVTVQSSGYAFRECGRPVKRDGKCGIHAAAADRSRANTERRLAERQRRDGIGATVRAFLAEHGIEGALHSDLRGNPTGKVVISRDELLRLMGRAS